MEWCPNFTDGETWAQRRKENCLRTKRPGCELGCSWLWNPHCQILLPSSIIEDRKTYYTKEATSRRKHQEQNDELTFCSLFFWGDKCLFSKQDNIPLLKLPMGTHTFREVLQMWGWLKFKHIPKKLKYRIIYETVTNCAKEGKKIQGLNLHLDLMIQICILSPPLPFRFKVRLWFLVFSFFLFFFFKYLLLFIYLAVPGLSCSMWDLVPWSGIEPGLPHIGSMETSREAPEIGGWDPSGQLCWWTALAFLVLNAVRVIVRASSTKLTTTWAREEESKMVEWENCGKP